MTFGFLAFVVCCGLGAIGVSGNHLIAWWILVVLGRSVLRDIGLLRS